MFRVHSTATSRSFRLAIVSLLTLSAAAFAVTVWVMVDIVREQEIVQELIGKLPSETTPVAEELAGELRWQFRLSILVVLNLVVTAFAVMLLWRAYRSSEESLRDIKSQAGDILSSMDLAVITTDLNGIVTSINRCGIELLTLDGEFVGRPLEDLSKSTFLEEFRLAMRASGQRDFIKDFSHSINGSIRVLRAFWQPLQNYDQEDIGNVLQLRDVTERVLMDERLLRMERYMGLGSLAAGLHHEIKNPLAALSLHVQLLEEEIAGPQTSDDVHEMLGVITTEVTRVGGVLENFRDFASLGRLNLTDLDLAKLVDRQVKLIRPQADSQEIQVRVELPAELMTPVHADRVRLEQVLLNLLINAMEAMPDGGQLIIRVSMVEISDAANVRLEVIDTGNGIPATIHDRIFDPYFTTKGDGTGMGLALCDKIMRQHDGSLEFHSSDSGTVFEMTLPIECSPSKEVQDTL
jgi:PAS domain S-box-containing protein